MTRTLVVTNDFPPRQGGIQTFVAALLATRPPESLVVLASDHPGAAAHDAGLPYEVVRAPTGMLLPTRSAARTAARLAREHDCRTAFFGAAPFGSLLAGMLADRIGAPHTVMVTGAFCIAGSIWFTFQMPKMKEIMRPIYQEKGLLPVLTSN